MGQNTRDYGDEALIRTTELTKDFGGIRALDNISLSVKRGKVCSIIGPNGAGKTTLFNVIFGILPPTSGRVFFEGRDITKLGCVAISHLGIGRSFQGYNLFTNLTTLENVRIACQSRERINFNILSDVKKFDEPVIKAYSVLERVGLTDMMHKYPHELSHGDHRMLEIGIAMAVDPVILLLDEPTSGLAPEETSKMIRLIEKIRKEYTIILIEHKMMVVMSVSDEIIVLQQGRVIAEGNCAEIEASKEVQEAYLGGYEGSAFRN